MSLSRLLAGGAVVGAAFGAVEMALKLVGETDPSVLRREPFLLCYASALYAILGALSFALAGFVARLTGARSSRAVFAGVTVAIVLSGTLYATAGGLLSKRYGSMSRVGALLGVAVVSALVGVLFFRLLSRRHDGALLSTLAAILQPRRSLAVAVIALLLTCTGVLLLGGEQPREGERGATEPSSISGHSEPGQSDSRPNIVLVVVDTLRADALGVYSGGVGRTPAADRLASQGTLFEHAAAEASWTLPSVVSILTSSYPHDHGLVDFDGNVSESLDSLPRALNEAGYECRAIVGNPLMSEQRGYAAGYHFYDVYGYRLESQLLASRVFSGAIQMSGAMGSIERTKSPVLWLEPTRLPYLTTRLSFYVQDEDLNDRLFCYSQFPVGESSPTGRPLFLYIQYVAPHTPYLEHPYRFIKSQPQLVEGNLQVLRELYAGAVTYWDSVFEELLSRLKSAGILDNAIIVLTSDHGEEFLEHGRWEHGHSLYEEVLRVPLIFQGPGIRSGARIDRRVPLIDVAPTLLDLAGVPVPESFRGESLRSILTDGEGMQAPTDAPRALYSELSSRYLNKNAYLTSVVSGNWKIIRSRKPTGELIKQEIFDLSSDPGEKRPIATLPEGLKPLEEGLIAFEGESD
ncbi:MAG TPA: sulfatase-like hydrolase/transferase, partial [Planctomycetota bacterium]|nr:sulfatase-like hydrolase/transferase [Planctomycetota bacterium]